MTAAFASVSSADGTRIAFERAGEGPPLVLVAGAFCDRSARASGTPLAALLAHRFTVFSYDRRARGDSEGAPPWAAEREIEDLAAVIEAAGGKAAVFGNSSGGLLALDASRAGLAITKVALYEPPVILDPERAGAFEELARELDAHAASDRRADAVTLYFTKVMQMPAPAVAGMRASAPTWSALEALAHTLGADLRLTARGPARLEHARSVRAPVVALAGEGSPPWMRAAIESLTRALPDATYRVLPGQTHAVDPAALALALTTALC